MSEERIQEIKDSINFQYELIVSKGIDKSALLFTDEEQELLEEVERLNNIINELEKSKEKQINDYEILILGIERYLNCYQYFLETQEENNKKIANMIHEFSLGSDKSEK